MKQSRFLCIQGKYAPQFHLKNNCSQNFRSLIESVTLSSVLVVSSRYKSDVLYTAEEDLSETIIKMWSACRGIRFTDSLINNFITATGQEDLLEYYFVKLAHLSMHHDWYLEYCDNFNDICTKEPNHLLLKPIIACNKHLKATSSADGGLPEMTSGQLKFSASGFRELARSIFNDLNSN